MTLAIESTVASALASAGTSNNPLIAWYNNGAVSGTHSTGTGTQVAAAALAFTGTTYDAWICSPATGIATLETDLGSATSITFGAVAAHNIATVGGTVSIQYSTNGGSTWNDCGAGTVTPTDNQAIGWYFDTTIARDWRVLVTGATDDVEIAVAFIGTVLTTSRRIYQGYRPALTPTNIALQANVSEGGNLLGSAVVRTGSTAQASLSNVEPSFFRGAAWLGFQRHFNTGGGFFWAWRPTKYGDFHYAWREGAVLAPTNSGPRDLMAAQFGMRLHDDPTA